MDHTKSEGQEINISLTWLVNIAILSVDKVTALALRLSRSHTLIIYAGTFPPPRTFKEYREQQREKGRASITIKRHPSYIRVKFIIFTPRNLRIFGGSY